MYYKLLLKIPLCFVFLLFGCQQESIENKKNETQAVKQEASLAEKSEVVGELSPKKVNLALNGSKYAVDSVQLRKGDKIYNPDINQEGMLTGKIVVVNHLAEPIQVDSCFVSQLAGKTFEVNCNDTTLDLYPIYQQLVKKFGNKSVEIGINYTPKDERPIY